MINAKNFAKLNSAIIFKQGNCCAGFTLAEDATHEDMLPSKAKGFTLAEVLITLGIIGVVAAMTIPTLIANTRSQQYRSQFKKTLSTLNQAALMAQAQYDFDFGSLTGVGSVDDNPQIDKTMTALLNGTLSGSSIVLSSGLNDYSRGTKIVVTQYDSLASDYMIYALADGGYVAISHYGESYQGCTLPVGSSLVADLPDPNDSNAMIKGIALKNCIGFIDVNGKTKPNKEVQCASEDTTLDPSSPCTVDNASMGDIFPVVFHDGTVEPASNAAAYVLHTAK